MWVLLMNEDLEKLFDWCDEKKIPTRFRQAKLKQLRATTLKKYQLSESRKFST